MGKATLSVSSCFGNIRPHPLPIVPLLFLQHFNKNEPVYFTQLQGSLMYLHMVVAAGAETLTSSDLI